ncbi:MAG: hypothetical protein ACKO0V_07160, partial [bacterium]
MKNVLGHQLSDEDYAKLLQSLWISGLSFDELTSDILQKFIEKMNQQEVITETTDFEASLNYALQK